MMIRAISQKLADSWPLKSALADAKDTIKKRGSDHALAEKFERASTATFVISMLFLIWLTLRVAAMDSAEIINTSALFAIVVAAIALGRPTVLVALFASLIAFPLVFAALMPAASAYVSAQVAAFPLSEIALAIFLILLAAYFQNLARLLRKTGGEE